MTTDLESFNESITLYANYPSNFQDKVNVGYHPDDCFLWLAMLDDDGYARIKDGKRKVKAHRYAWDFIYGDLLSTDVLLHSCDVRHCVNVKHLSKGTQLENIQDMDAKGRRGTTKGRSSATKEQQEWAFELYLVKGWTLEETAEEVGLSTSQVWRICKNE